MAVYKVEYYTLGKGKDVNNEVGNLALFEEIAYIQCKNTSCIEVLLEKYYQQPRPEYYYQPVIRKITALKGHCIVED